MLKYLKIMVLLVVSLFLLGAGSNNMYVQNKAKILSSPSFKAKVVVVAKKGQVLEVVKKKGRWYQVKIGNKTGWVSRLLVSKTPPMKKISVLASRGKKISKKARRRASVMTSAAAARGLAEDDRRRVGAGEMSDYAALEQMESVNVTEDEVDNFIGQAQ